MTFCRSLLPGDLLLRVHASGLYDGSTLWWKFYCGWTNWHKALSQWVCGLWAIICPEEKQTEWTWRNHRRWTTMDICEQIFFTEVWKWSMWVGINRAKKCEYKFYAMQKKKILFQVRSEVLTTYALCGFANFSSLGIVIGGLCEYFTKVPQNKIITLTMMRWLTQSIVFPIKASICPSRRSDVSSLVVRAMLTGTCASLVNACVAGESSQFYSYSTNPQQKSF